ncbi:MAG: hypothetical protein ACE5IB_05845 [Candidatus Geothermarchaeales archaeon]
MISVSIDEELAEELLEMAQGAHPNAVTFLLRGKRERKSGGRRLTMEDYLIPPVGWHMQYGPWYATDFSPFLLHADARLLGEARSKPNGETSPSDEDLSRFTGGLLILLSSPYGLSDIHAYDLEGKTVALTILPGSRSRR